MATEVQKLRAEVARQQKLIRKLVQVAGLNPQQVAALEADQMTQDPAVQSLAASARRAAGVTGKK